MILRYAYDPFKKYHVSAPGIRGSGEGLINEATIDILDLLVEGTLSGGAAQRMVYDEVQQLTPDEAELLKRIIDKDMRCGISAKTINAVWPGLIPSHDVMLAHKFDHKRIKYPCWSTIKIDGVRSIYRDGKFYTRRGHRLVGLKHLSEHLVAVDAPELDLELYVEGANFQTGSGRIRSHQDVPEARAIILDLPASTDSFYYRLSQMWKYQGDHIFPVPCTIVETYFELQAMYQRAILDGYEGLVVRPRDYQYERRRSYNWLKMKQVETVDLPVIGFFEGEGKYVGMLGGIIVDNEGVPVRVGSGFSDDDRVHIWNTTEVYLGATVEILYHEVTPDGSLRHPRFFRWRFDK